MCVYTVSLSPPMRLLALPMQGSSSLCSFSDDCDETLTRPPCRDLGAEYRLVRTLLQEDLEDLEGLELEGRFSAEGESDRRDIGRPLRRSGCRGGAGPLPNRVGRQTQKRERPVN